MEEIKEILEFLNKRGLYPEIKTISSAPVPEVIINGKKVISFCSNNYLGLAYSEKLINIAIEATRKYGVGSGGSRLISGNLNIFEKLENELAQFKHTEDSIVFTTGYMANVGTISAIANPITIPSFFWSRKKTIIFSDALNHASIIDGCTLSKTKVIIYKHCDMDNLEKELRKYRNFKKLIVTDGVFSMDGDVAPLPEIVTLTKKYEAMIMVDDAHATGILGKTGSGTPEYFGLDNEIDIKMGTLSKAIGVLGGYVAGSKELIKYLRIAARSYVFATATSPILAACIIAAIKELKENGQLRKRLQENADRLRNGFKSLGFDTLKSQTQIIPLLIKNEEKAINVAQLLFERGFFAPCMRWPAVEKNKARIRFTVMSLHTQQQIDKLLEEMQKIGKTFGII